MMKKVAKLEQFDRYMNELSDSAGKVLVNAFHYLALFAIGGAIAWSGFFAFLEMAAKASIDDILLLFIYLELGAMIGIYYKTNHMPVRFLVYIGVTALTRMLIGDIQHHHKPDEGILYVCGAILMLALATLVFRFASYKYPSAGPREEKQRQAQTE